MRLEANDGWRGSRIQHLCAAAALLALLAGVPGCGGGGGGSAGPSGFSGAWYYDDSFGTGTRFDLVTRAEIDASISRSSETGRLGYGGGTFTDISVDTLAEPDETRINLRDVAPNPFALRKTLPPFSFTSGFVSGPVQPSPDGKRFAMHTRESAGLGEPFLDYVYVFNQALDISLRKVGYRDPAWLTNGRLVMAGEDGLYTVSVSEPAAPERLGKVGTAPSRPVVSPDGRSVAYLQGDIVWRIGTNGSGLKQLSVASVTADWPNWSPDGTQIVLVSGICGQFAGPDIVVISATATNQNLHQATTVARNNGAPARSCGPVYWLN